MDYPKAYSREQYMVLSILMARAGHEKVMFAEHNEDSPWHISKVWPRLKQSQQEYITIEYTKFLLTE